MRFHIGKRNIKTAIAVTLCVLISWLLKLEYPFFVVIAAIFSMETSLASSYKAGLFRLIGTAIGALVGVAFYFIQPGNAWLMGIGTVIFIFICHALKCDRAVPVAGVMFAAVMLSLNNKDPWLYSLSRVLDTFIGIAAAVGVNYLIFRPDNLGQLKKNIYRIAGKVAGAVNDLACRRTAIELDGINAEVVEAIRFLEAYREEFRHRTKKNPAYEKADKDLETLKSILAHLRTVNELGEGCSISPENVRRMSEANPCGTAEEAYRESRENIIYNYHIGRALDGVERLNKLTVDS